jgi:hypothetical protein
MRPETQAILDGLTAQEVSDLTVGLLARERKKARADAQVFGDLFASVLRVAGEPELSRQVEVILLTLRQNIVTPTTPKGPPLDRP